MRKRKEKNGFLEIEILLLIDKVIETTPSIFVTKPKFMRKEKKNYPFTSISLE